MADKVTVQIRKLLNVFTKEDAQEVIPESEPDLVYTEFQEEYRKVVEKHAAGDPIANYIRETMRRPGFLAVTSRRGRLCCVCDECQAKRLQAGGRFNAETPKKEAP